MFDHARKVFDELPKLNCPRTVISLNALLSACVESKKFDEVGGIFEEVGEGVEIEPDVISYTTVIKGFCESNDVDSAMRLLEKMEGSEIRPNVVSYNTVLCAYYKENNLAEAEKLLRRMEEMGVIANVRTYNARLRCLVQNDRIREALELVEKMVKEEVNPDSQTYYAVLKWYVCNGDLEGAKMLHGKMTSNGCHPDFATYQMLITFSYNEGDIDFAFELCKQSVELMVYIHKSLMDLVVDALIKGSKTEEAKELVSLVKSSKKHRYKMTLPVTTALSD